MQRAKVIICPYCGETQPAQPRCRGCGGLFEPLSRQATHNAMGPWFVRDLQRPFQPGCGYETLVRLVERGAVTKYSILRGPTTRQFWTVARHVPGVAHLLGYCHACDAEVDPEDHGCPLCGVPFGAYLDRNFLGLPEVRPLPGEAPEDDGGTAGLPGAWTPPLMRPRGLSSFARDEELLAAGHARGSRGTAADGPAPVAAPRAAAVATAFAPAAVSEGSAPARGEDLVTSPVLRSLQRRVVRQERTIRWLTMLVIAMALGAAAFNWLAAKRPSPEDAGAGAPTGAPESPSPGEAPSIPEPGRGIGAEVAEETLAPAPGSEPGEAPDEAPYEAEPPAWAADHERARQLAESSADATLPIEDRITLAEEALAILKEIAARVPAEEQPGGLDDEIRRLEDAVERLRLKRDFFR